MRTKAKKFSHKLLALFLAVIMALTCFTGVISAYGASIQDYHDDNIEYNDLAWSVLSDEQVATALLDYADEMLEEFGPQIDSLIQGLLPTSGVFYYDAGARTIEVDIIGLITASIKVYTHSVDELLETLESVQDVLDEFGGLFGDVGNVNFTATDGMRRSNTSSCDIVRAVFGLLQKNSADYNGNDVIGEFLRGGFDLGTVGSFVSVDIYGSIGNALGADDGYESNFVYNIVQALLFNNTNWFTAEEIAAYKSNPSSFVFDEVLLEKMSSELLSKISVLVTYNDGTSSATRKAVIDKEMESGKTYAEAAVAHGYDPNLVYSSEEAYAGNVLLFSYGYDEESGAPNGIELTSSDTLFSFAYKALKTAWQTVLSDTIKLVHVNYDVDRNHGSNFDNAYYYWAEENIAGGWDVTDPETMYSATNVESWANAVYAEYEAESAEEFLGWVKDNLVHDRTIAEDATGSWDDIDSTTLFNKLRYSPLADYYFDMQTGPVNLYFEQLGTPNLDSFFENDYDDYFSLVAGLNDCLIAAVNDIFVASDNIYVDAPGDTARPTMTTTGNFTTIDDSAIQTITNTLVNNTLKMVQYVADTTDKNILNGFYIDNGEDAQLSEENLESAMIPFLIACIGNVNLGSGRLDQIIHPADWDACNDAEAVAYVCLREYLSYILPSKDYSTLITTESDGSINATLEGTLLPMARDAVTYVMEGYVPVTDTSGNRWQVTNREVGDPNTLLQLLNSVICYYADDYDMAMSDDRAMGVASLLGVCDNNGESLINANNDIWTNIDLVANHLLPVAGTLQGTGYGQFSSEDLIWNDIVLGILEIGDIDEATGFGGVKTFIYRLLSIISSDPIQNTSVINTVYDLVKDLLNAIFGPRYSGQSYVPVPDRTSAHPFDDILQVGTIAGTNGDNVGIIQKLICNVAEFTGYGTSGVATYPDSVLRGIMFALQAVNSFIPEAISNISEHELEMASAEIADPFVLNCQSGQSYSSSVVVTNNVTGLNNAYVDGMNGGAVEQLSRYYITLTDAQITTEGGGSATISQPGWDYLAPGESATLTTNAQYLPLGSDESTTYEIVVTYDITDENGDVIYSDLTTRCYQYLTGTLSWESIVYPADRIYDDGVTRMLPTQLESSSANRTLEHNGYRAFTSDTFAAGNILLAGYPEYVVLGTTNLGAVNNYGIRVVNTSNSWVGNDRSVDGMYYYDEATVWDDRTQQNVTVNSSNAIPVFDPETGDLIKKEYYDYSLDGGVSWNRGSGNAGYTEEQITSTYNGLSDEQKANFETRDHVAYTLQEAISEGIIKAYHQEGGVYEHVYLSTDGDLKYDTTLGQISMRGPADGFYVNFGKVTVNKGQSIYHSFCRYDGETEVQPGEYSVNMCLYNSTESGYVDFTLVVGDDSGTADLTTQYNELSDLFARYRESDFTNPDVYDTVSDALVNALAAQSTVLTPTTAINMSDQTVLTATTAVVATEYGDRAYVPFTSTDGGVTDLPYTLPADVKADAYLGGSTEDGVTYGGVDGVYYFDAACTMPIYSNVALTSANVTNGKDPAGVAVIEGTGEDAGKYWLRNEPLYETEWNTDSFPIPWAEPTDVQATNDDGALLYEQVQYVYRDANSDKVNSDRDWVAKFPETSYARIKMESGSSVDTRGTISQASDYISYATDMIYDSVNTSIAQDLFEDISLVRNNMNNNNFDVVTYNEMVNFAKRAEADYTLAITYNAEEPVIDEETGQETDETEIVSHTDRVPFSSYNGYVNNENITITNIAVESTISSVQVEEYVRLFNFYMSKVVERGYQGDQLEAEILCASGNTYANLTATPATYDEDGTLLTPAVVTKGASAVDPKFGAWSAEGTLVNEGETVYSAETWDAYVTALADAVALAQLGNGSYAHKTANYYNAAASDYDAQISDCYYTDTALQAAEIALEEDIAEPTGVAVTGSLEIASNSTGASTGLPVYGEYTVSLYADADRSQLVQEVTSVYDAETETNTFALTDLDAGTYYASITSTYSIPLNNITVIVGDQDIDAGAITVVPCDLTTDGSVTADDAKIVYSLAAASGELTPYADFTGEGAVTADDAKVVYTFAAGYTLPAVTIQ